MIELCPRCGSHAFATLERTVVRRIGARRFTKAIAVERCEVCDFSPIPVEAIVAFESTIAVQVALFGPATNETFELLRRTMRLDPEQTARALGVSIGDVLGWLGRRRKVPLSEWFLLARLVRDRAAAEAPNPCSTPRVRRALGPMSAAALLPESLGGIRFGAA